MSSVPSVLPVPFLLSLSVAVVLCSLHAILRKGRNGKAACPGIKRQCMLCYAMQGKEPGKAKSQKETTEYKETPRRLLKCFLGVFNYRLVYYTCNVLELILGDSKAFQRVSCFYCQDPKKKKGIKKTGKEFFLSRSLYAAFLYHLKPYL